LVFDVNRDAAVISMRDAFACGKIFSRARDGVWDPYSRRTVAYGRNT
jgi:hypothetical protein